MTSLPTDWAKQITVPTVLKVADAMDGHTIFEPEYLLELGLPAHVVEAYTVVFKSDLSHAKATIFDNKTGKPVKEQKGIYGLNLLTGLANSLQVKYPGCLGRGTQAAKIRKALHEALATTSE